MQQYLDHMQNILDNGVVKTDRTGTGTKSIFGHQMRFDLREGFPLVTTKKCHLKSIIHELLWFLRGETNINTLDAKIWDEWADKDGELGPVYGKQWRSWATFDDSESGLNCIDENGVPFSDMTYIKSIDQIATLIERLKTNPDCRRLIVSAWNVSELSEMALQPCHVLFQFNTEPMTTQERIAVGRSRLEDPDAELDGPFATAIHDAKTGGAIQRVLDVYKVPKYHLSCQLYQRSADWFLGVPFNIASYALLTMMVAKVVNMVPLHFVHSFGDTHLYLNHEEQAYEQLSREAYSLPTVRIANRDQGIDDFVYEDFILTDYQCHPAISAPVAV